MDQRAGVGIGSLAQHHVRDAVRIQGERRFGPGAQVVVDPIPDPLAPAVGQVLDPALIDRGDVERAVAVDGQGGVGRVAFQIPGLDLSGFTSNPDFGDVNQGGVSGDSIDLGLKDMGLI